MRLPLNKNTVNIYSSGLNGKKLRHRSEVGQPVFAGPTSGTRQWTADVVGAVTNAGCGIIPS
jgi:hypothetical protein